MSRTGSEHSGPYTLPDIDFNNCSAKQKEEFFSHSSDSTADAISDESKSRNRTSTADSQREKDAQESNNSEPANNDEEQQDAGNGDEEQQEGNGDVGNGDEEKQGGPPQPVGFWDPRLKHVRHEAFFKWTVTTGILMAFILGAMSLYWGVFSKAEENLSTLKVFVVDFDGKTAPYNTTGVKPLVGPTIAKLAQQLVDSGQPTLGYKFPPLSQFDYDPIQVRQSIYDWDAWAAIIINPNATAMLDSAVRNGNATYDPLGACQLIFISSRDDTNWYDFIYPTISPFMTQATSKVGEEWAKSVMQQAATDKSLVHNAAAAPQALSPAIGFSQFDLRPFYPYTAIPAVSIGLIYLIIISFFSFAFYLPIHFKYLKPEGHPPLHFWQLCIWRWASTISAYFMLSLAYSFVSMAFGINFYGDNPVYSQTEPTVSGNEFLNPDAYGNATFPVYWMLNFFGMIALGLACENVAMFVGQPWTGLWLIFWVITNVSTSFYDIGIEPGFYEWGYAWPLHYVVRGSRQILFDLHNTLGLDFGVLIAWGAVNTALFPFACYFMRWKSKHHVHEYYK